MNKKNLVQKFIGTWKLNKWVVSKPDGKETYPFLGNVNGFLIYHPDGWMSATLMQKDRSHVSDNRSEISKIAYELKNNTVLEEDTHEVVKNFFLAANGYVSYAGRYEADDTNVYHNVEVSLLPQWVNTTLTRKHKFSSENNMLELSAEFDGFKDILVWSKC